MGRATSFAIIVCIATVLGLVSSEKEPSEPESPTLVTGGPILSEPEDQQAHSYTANVEQSPHIASGNGLHVATTDAPTSFTIELVGDDGPDDEWTPNGEKFVYVWIASQDQIFIAEVADNGDGTLTATYQSSFPGDYLVYIEEVEIARHDEGRPIAGSPFSLTITGDPTLDVDELPLCGTDEEELIEESFWRPGTWVSSRLASATHGVIRNGWVFQPRSCVHDTFAYEDLMLLASLQKETWILVLGGSVQRGLFLTLVDMALAQGQKDDLSRSVLEKCWGYANVRVGNLRLTYQDLRLYRTSEIEDVVICNNEKLISGSSAAYVKSCEQFLASMVFKSGSDWPAAILAPSNMERKGSPNLPTKKSGTISFYTWLRFQTKIHNELQVPVEALPLTWTGKLLMVDHMAGYGNHWRPDNPTATALQKAGVKYHGGPPFGDDELGQMRSYKDDDPRVKFVSAFPMYQAKLFENQNTKNGVRKYGDSVHYHYDSKLASGTETNNGQRMVQSTITEMLANILIGEAVGSKAELQKRAESMPDIGSRSTTVGSSFQIEHDCPANLVPFHVKPVPELTRITVEALPQHDQEGEVWDEELCPSWCMEEEPVSQTPTESGLVDVRECSTDSGPRL